MDQTDSEHCENFKEMLENKFYTEKLYLLNFHQFSEPQERSHFKWSSNKEFPVNIHSLLDDYNINA